MTMAADCNDIEDRTFPDIPYEWSGNVTDEEIHQVYEHLKRERFFVTEAYDGHKNHAGNNPGLVLKYPESRFANVRMNGYVYFVFSILETVVVTRYTEEAWERALKR
jgi:hypothetical protein